LRACQPGIPAALKQKLSDSDTANYLQQKFKKEATQVSNELLPPNGFLLENHTLIIRVR
jgi:pantothenate kinase